VLDPLSNSLPHNLLIYRHFQEEVEAVFSLNLSRRTDQKRSKQ
jgi:hypothetical protein